MTVTRLVRLLVSGILFSILLAGAAVAAEPCQTVVGRLATVEGQVEVQQSGSPTWQAGVLGGELCQGDTVRAGARSRATISLINQAVLRVDQNTAMRLDNISGVTEERSVLSLLKGAFQSFSRKPRGFEVNTPYLNGSIEGTEFVFRVEDGQSELTVLEGLVVASNDQGKVSVSGGESAVGEQGKAPSMRTVVNPRDAVQWSLYYPPVLATQGGSADAQAPLHNAASLLSVGRVDEARASIDAALEQDPNAGLAYALRTVINVVQNNTEQALADGNKAVELSPDSSAAKIALSYAQQAAFDIPAARDTLQQAVQQQPNDALALARLAELQLMSGDRKQARESARQAAALDPGLSRTQLTLGYAALAEFDNEAAKTAFKSAIDMSSSDPMAHLGLGLAKISGGDVAAGGRDIEVAVALDSNSALLRSYLGKTYFEEKRAPLDTEQFAIAKQLDPNDPTAYLYDGIAKQTENRPVEAVQDMEKSIELNDNRAIYRGRFLLDQDRAARGVSHARVYRDLGFTQLGINQASESIGLDPSNASAHRFLADTYREVRRHEIARVSEQLQAQMLQDVSLNPIQPSSTETNLNTVTQGGPASTGYNEFTPLFQRNRASATVSALGGSNDTKGGEAVVSGVYNNFSISAGTYHFDSDGWRPNNGLNQDIDNIFAQWAVSPSFNIQAEYRERESEEGDLAFNFDPDDFMQDKTVDRESETARLGLRFSPSINSDVLLSYIQNDRSEKDESSRPDDLLFPDDDFGLRLDERLKTDDEGDQYELQYLWQGKTMNLIAGAAVSEIDRDSTRELDVVDVQGAFGPPGTVIPLAAEQDSDKIDHDRGYLYLNFRPLDSLLFTLGASYEDFDRDEFDESGIYPKLGASWDVNDEITVRAAAFKVMKPVLVANRTLEPTQIVGFNQLFDDINATESKRYAIGVDWDAHRDLTFGAVISKRDMEEPQLQGDTQAVYEDREEENHQLFGYWTPTQSIAVSGKVIYDNYESDEGVATANGSRPLSVRTWSLPLGITYFHPSGVFAGLTGTHVDQKVRRDVNASLADGEDDFFLVDLSAGYRLPKRSGVLSISVKNLFDTEFSYQDDSYREFRDEPATGPYFPDLTILGQLSLSF